MISVFLFFFLLLFWNIYLTRIVNDIYISSCESFNFHSLISNSFNGSDWYGVSVTRFINVLLMTFLFAVFINFNCFNFVLICYSFRFLRFFLVSFCFVLAFHFYTRPIVLMISTIATMWLKFPNPKCLVPLQERPPQMPSALYKC